MSKITLSSPNIMQVNTQFKEGLRLEKTKQYFKAWEQYIHILRAQPHHVPSLKRLGNLAYQQKQYQQATKFFQQTLQLHPLDTETLFRLGQTQYGTENWEAAKDCFRKVIQLHPASDKATIFKTKLQLAKVLKQIGQTEEAAQIAQQLVANNARNASALSFLAQLKQQTTPASAYELFLQVIEIKPQLAAAYLNAGMAAIGLQKWVEAQQQLEKAIQLKPNWATPHVELATCCYRLGQRAMAQQLLEKAQQLAPTNVDTLQRLCNWYKTKSAYKKGYDTALKLIKNAPENEQGIDYMAYFLRALGNISKALPFMKKGYENNPDETHTYDLASAYYILKDYAKAKELYHKLLTLNPNYYAAQYHLINMRMNLADWSQRVADKALLLQTFDHHITAKAYHIPLPYLTLTCMGIPPALNKRVNQFLGEQIVQNKKQLKQAINTPSKRSLIKKKEVLRIGYISPDFRSHAMGGLLYQLFQHHDRARVKVYGYNLTIAEKNDTYHQSFVRSFDEFRNIYFDDLATAAEKIKKDELDILVDLGGYTTHTRAGILALQPAPIQVIWLGYPNTTGADFIQYILADEQLIPKELQDGYTEQVAYLPQGFTGQAEVIPEIPINRQTEGLAEDAFVFCGFHRTEKISPALYDTWMEIIKAVPNSVLWLSSFDKSANSNFVQYAQQKGISAERLVFAEKVSYPHFLKRLSLANMFLDALEYSAGATAVAAINMGLPLLTCTADTYVSRMGASVLKAAQLEIGICADLATYKSKAIRWATDRDYYQQLKQKIAAPAQLPLFDQKAFAGQLEATFSDLYHQHWVSKELLDNFPLSSNLKEDQTIQ